MTVRIDDNALSEILAELAVHRHTLEVMFGAIAKLSPGAKRELTKLLAGKFPKDAD